MSVTTIIGLCLVSAFVASLFFMGAAARSTRYGSAVIMFSSFAFAAVDTLVYVTRS